MSQNELFLSELLNIELPEGISIEWETKTVSHLGRVREINVPKIPLPQGRTLAIIKTALSNFSLYIKIATANAIADIDQEIAEEKAAVSAAQDALAVKNAEFDTLLEARKLEQDKELETRKLELEAKYNTVLTEKEEKIRKFHVLITRTGIFLLSLAVVFGFAMNYMNLHEFFGGAMAEKFGNIATIAILGFISLLIAVGFAFFALLKNKAMVKKALLVLPLDMLLAFLVANNIIPEGTGYTIFQVVSFLIYITQMYLILMEISNLFVGKGIEKGKEAQHYEEVFNAIF